MSKGTIQRTWIVSLETAHGVNLLAERLRVLPSALVDRLLVYGLEAAEAGEIDFQLAPVRYELV